MNYITLKSFLAIFISLFYVNAYTQTPCTGGNAGGYPCNAIDLMSVVSLSDMGCNEANDIWGWTDTQTGKEYAIFGCLDRTTFIDVSNPSNPIFLGHLPTHSGSSIWRDMKTYANHAFIVSEASNHGMQVFDLTQLRNVSNPPATFSETAFLGNLGNGLSISNSHNIVINEESGFAYTVGNGGLCSGGLAAIDISNPANPVFAGCFEQDGYTHDAQCVIYNGPDTQYAGKEICFNSNENTLTIVDVNDKTDMTQISRTGYTGQRYTHQGWLTEDHQYFLMNDELDESNNGHNTRTYIWDVRNLDNPIFMGYYEANVAAIDHNLYIKGNKAYMANYRSGLRVLDISDIANGNLSEIGYFDIYPSSNSSQFNGAWSNYPYFPSGNIIVSGIEQGLFVLRLADTTPTCNDGVQNGDETGVDCGGSCPACPPNPTCSDGIQNGDETSVDCGGSCPACPCNGNTITLTIVLDNYPEETTWSIVNANGNSIASGGTYANQPDGSTVIESLCISNGCYDFVINDSYGDGICCTYGVGSYSLTGSNGTTLASGGEFGSSESTNFCINDGPAPTCNDGTQNGNETGVDCGGPDCTPCYTCDDGVQNGNETGPDCGGPDCAACPPTGCTNEQIDFSDFESNWGIWNDGGSDCARFSSSYAYNSSRSARLRDNSSTSKMTTDDLNLSGYDDITVDFTYVAVSMDNSNEDFWLQLSTNGGASYSTIEEWNRGDEFENDVREFDAVNIQGPFSTNTRLRFRCDASGNQDWVYIDDVLITGCYSGNNISPQIPTIASGVQENSQLLSSDVPTLKIFPNPAHEYLNIEYTTTDLSKVTMYVLDLSGKIVHQQQFKETIGLQSTQLNTSQLNPGFYFVQLIVNDSIISRKFVKAN